MKWEENEENHWWYKARRDMINGIVRKRNMKILDVGCGNGALFTAFKNDREIIGTDNNKTAIRMARKKAEKMKTVNVKIVIASGENLCFKSNYFDLVVCADVLEHIKDDFKTLQGINRVLKRRGEVVITIPAFRKLWGLQDEEQQHYRRYHLFQIKHLIRSAGLKLTYLRYWNSFLMPFAIIFRKIIRSNIKAEMKSYLVFNPILYYILKIETVINFVPFGVSLIAKAQKK